MAKVLYTAEVEVRGGREDGHGRTSDGAFEVDVRPPGTAGGTNPEQLFALGYAACFNNALGAVARRAKLEIGAAVIGAEVDLVTTEERGFTVAVRMHVTLDGLEAGQAAEIVRAAHAVCPYSNATRGNVDVTFTANGQPV